VAWNDVFITLRDGVRLAATLLVPEGEGPWPAILEATPYRKDDVTSSYHSEYQRVHEAGYAVCRLDVRGTGSSEGIAEDEYTATEHQDLLEVIDWLSKQEWSNGNIGMYGYSYSGFNSLQVAMLRPPALKAIIPIYASDDRYADDVHYFGGALKALDLLDYPLYMVAENALPPAPPVYGEGWREEWERRVAGTEPWTIRWHEHQTFDDYWKHGTVRPDYEAIEAATMILAGWADGYRAITFRGFAGMRCPKRAIIGPWAHASPDSAIPGPNVDIVPEMLRWWDRWLKGIDNGVDREPPIVVYVRRSTEPAPDLAHMRGEWRYEPTWPLERGVELPLELEKADTPGREGGGPDELAVRGDVGWTGWISCAGHFPYGLPQDQRPDEAYSLVYDWALLEEELEILGHPLLRVTVTSSAPVAYLSAKLCDVFANGTSALVSRGLLNLTHRESRESPSPLEPGRPYEVELELEVTSWVFEQGHRLRLDLAGSDWPNTWPPPQPVTLTIDRSGSSLVLPVVEGPSPLRERPQLPESTEEQERAPDGNDSWHVTWRIEEDVLRRERRAFASSWGSSEAEGVGPRMDTSYGGEVGVSTTDPGNAWAIARATYELRWPQVEVQAEARQRFRSDARAYHLELELDVKENGELRWQRRWDRTFPRELQ